MDDIFSYFVPVADNVHEISELIFLEKKQQQET